MNDTDVKNRDKPGRRQSDSGSFCDSRCLYRLIPAAMKTPVLDRKSHGGAPFRSLGDTVLHGTSRLSPG